MKKLNKLMAALLALVMCLSLLPMSVFAADKPNPYQDKINAANDVKEDADTAKGDSNIYWNGVDQQLGEAEGNNADATDKSGQVQDAVKKAEEDVAEVVEEQQGLVNAAEAAANGQISDAATAINGETEKVTNAVKEATDALTGVQEKLDALKDTELTPAEKVAAAEEAQTAADAAVKAAEDAAKVVETAQATVDAAVTKAEEAKAVYDDAVKAAKDAVGDAKAAALDELNAAKETLEAAKADLAAATTAKETAESAKAHADDALKTAQDMLKAAQEAYEGIEWPDADNEKGSVTEEQIKDKYAEAMTASGEASQAQKKVDELADEIEKLGKELGKTNTESDTKTAQKTTSQNQYDDLTSAMNTYEGAVTTAKETFDGKVETAKKAYLDNVSQFFDLATDENGDWAKNQVALKDGNGGWKDFLYYDDAKTVKINNSEFAYYLVVCELEYGKDSDKYNELKEYYDKWIDEVGSVGSKYRDVADKCFEAVDTKVTQKITEAKTAYTTDLSTAESTLKGATKLGSVQAVTEEISKLDTQINNLEREIKTLQTRIQELKTSIGEKSGEKSTQEGIAITKAQEAAQAREAAQKLTDLLELQKAMEAAQAALKAAQDAQDEAAKRQAAAQEKLDAYTDAQKAVKEAEEALKAKLSGDLKNGDLSLNAGANFDEDLAKLAAKLKEAQDAAEQAKNAYDKAKNDADQAKKDADQAKADADQAKKDADQELEDFNNRYDGGDDTGDTDTTIDDTLIPLASGPVTRAQFVDYLWRHEGSPAAESELFADHEYAPAIAWALSVEIIGEDFQPDELVTVADVRAILGRFAQVFGTNAVDAADLTTLTGADDEAVLNCDQVLAEFFGEEYVVPEDLDSLETDTAA